MGEWPALRGTLADAARATTQSRGRIFRGDVRSANWDGGGDLADGADSTATAGYLIDFSSGSAQFQNIFAEGGELTTFSILGVLTMGADGVIRTASTGKRIELFNPDGDDLLAFYSGNAKESDKGLIKLTSEDTGGNDFINFIIQSPKLTGSSGRNSVGRLVISGSGDNVGIGASATLSATTGGTLNATATLDAIATGSGTSEVHLDVDSNTEVRATSTIFESENILNSTIGDAENVHVDGSGRLFLSTSTAENKDDIEPWASDGSILNVQPVSFYPKAGNKKKGEEMKRIGTRKNVGLTFEDVQQHFPKGALPKFKSLDWHAITTALLSELVTLRQRVNDLEAAQ